MAIDKALYQAPQGITQDQQNTDAIEVEIEDPESVHIGMGDLSIDIEPAIDEEEFNKNLAEDLNDSILTTIASELTADYEDDCTSRKDWIQTYVDGLELLGMKIEERSEP